MYLLARSLALRSDGHVFHNADLKIGAIIDFQRCTLTLAARTAAMS